MAQTRLFPGNGISLPIGYSDFRDLRHKEKIYVDKTSYIAHILTEGHKYIFLSRPRRFGKSLLLSTLKSLFTKDARLFQDTAVRDHPIWGRIPECPVLCLDMALASVSNPMDLERKIPRVLSSPSREWTSDGYGITRWTHGYAEYSHSIPPGRAVPDKTNWARQKTCANRAQPAFGKAGSDNHWCQLPIRG